MVDNGPTARHRTSGRSTSTARYVPEPKRGYGNARNRGLAEAGGDIIYFLDDDCVPEPDWSDVLWNVLNSGDADLASGSRTPASRALRRGSNIFLPTAPFCRRSRCRSRAASVDFQPDPAPRCGRESRLFRYHADHVRGSRFHHSRAQAWLSSALRTQGSRYALSRHSPAFRLPGKMRHYGTGTSQYFRRWRDEEPLARLFPASPALRLLMLPALSAAGTAYLVARNLAAMSRRTAAQSAVVRGPVLVAMGRL